MRMQTALATALLAACLPAAAQSLKPGLWEINNKMGGNAQMDQAMAQMQKELASMPPEQRKQMEAMMAQRGMSMPGGAGKGMTIQSCMTKEMAERNDVPMQDGCKITKQERSGKTMKMAFACTNPPSSGDGEFTFVSDQAYTSKMNIKTTVEGKPQTMTMDASGKWLAADCGKLAPKK